MAKKPPPGYCVYCGDYYNILTWDHLIPSSWYPETTQKNLEKWKVPACRRCNSNYGKIEKDLLERIGLCLDPKDARAIGIPERALRALDPNYAKNEKDRLRRKKKREKIQREALLHRKKPAYGIFPNFGKKFKTGSISIPMAEQSLREFGRKIIKGVGYLIFNKIIADNYFIEIYFVEDKNVISLINFIEKHGKLYMRGPGIKVNFVPTSDSEINSLYRVEIWGQFRFHGVLLTIEDKKSLDNLRLDNNN